MRDQVNLAVTRALPEGAILLRIDNLGRDIGRLWSRWKNDPDAYETLLLERIADHTEWLHALVRPNAAELYRDFYAASGDEDIAVDEALAVIDREVARFRHLIGRGRD